jgi:hypothetical protein
MENKESDDQPHSSSTDGWPHPPPLQPAQPIKGRYYHILGINRNASQDDVRRAYRQLALRYHPDKLRQYGSHLGTNQASIQGEEELFKDISRAYEILCDTEKRRIYDQYDETGIRMYEHVGDQSEYAKLFFDPRYLCLACIISSLLVVVVLLFPIFLALQLDVPLNWNWALVAIPIWIVDVFVALIIISILRGTSKTTTSTEEDRDGDFSHRESHILGMSIWEKGATIVWFLSILAFEIFLVLRLNHQIIWNWAFIFIPYWIVEFIVCFRASRIVHKSVSMFASAPLDVRLLLMHSKYQWSFYRILFSIFLVLRIQNVITWNWALIWLPVYLGLVVYLATKPILLRRKLPFLPTDEDRQQESVMFVAKIILMLVLATLFTASMVMLIMRLNETIHYRVATILIPVFIFMGLLFCTCCCLVPCFLFGAQKAQEEEFQQRAGETNPSPMYSTRPTGRSRLLLANE